LFIASGGSARALEPLRIAAGEDVLSSAPKLSSFHATEPSMSLQQFTIFTFTSAELDDAVDARR